MMKRNREREGGEEKRSDERTIPCKKTFAIPFVSCVLGIGISQPVVGAAKHNPELIGASATIQPDAQFLSIFPDAL